MFGSNSSNPGMPRILVVDDFADNRDLLQVLLESEGYSVETAAEGYSAIAKIERQLPDLVLLDLMMPDLDGYGVVEWIAQNHPFIPILVVTGCNEFPEFCTHSKLIADCIRKPIAIEELLEKTKSFVSISQFRRRFISNLIDENVRS